jgi:hypothetical protein
MELIESRHEPVATLVEPAFRICFKLTFEFCLIPN